jgi:nucleotide-binding universal stress UspA family protein
MFARLLVGLDGSPGADAALKAAVALGRRFSSTIVLAAITDVRLLEPPGIEAVEPLWTGGAIPAVAAELATALEETARRRLEDGAEQVRAAGLRVETAQSVGFVEEELLMLSDRAEAIVMGRRGDVHAGPSALGEVTTHIVRKSRKPVVVAADAPSTFEHPVVAYDGGETSTNALALAARYAEATGALLRVVHVPVDEQADELLARAAAFLSSQQVAHETHRLEGDVTRAISDFVTRSGADLLVVGAHGGRRRSWAVGSHAEALLRGTAVPVIVNR